jgi:hypothetical protein
MGVAGLFEELLKDVSEVAASLLGFGVDRTVGTWVMLVRSG